MAHIRERKAADGTVYYQANIRRRGRPHMARTFLLRSDAEAWAKRAEQDMKRGPSCERVDLTACGCYIIWDGKECVYVGSSRSNVLKRVCEWTGRAATHFSIVPCEPRDLLDTEYRLINIHQPRYNKLGKCG